MAHKQKPWIICPGFFVYYSMEVILRTKEQECIIYREIETPDTDNVMYAIELLINKAELDRSTVEDYILAWAEEIKIKNEKHNS